MGVKEWRQELHMSQRQFSACFGIPLGTLRNWEQGIAAPPEYVLKMLRASIGRDSMINIETIKFVKMLDELAELTLGGIEEFSKATPENCLGKVFYDENAMDEKGQYRVVRYSLVTDDHHDVICYCDSDTDEYTVRVVFPDDGPQFQDDNPPFIEVRFAFDKTVIFVEDGEWHFD